MNGSCSKDEARSQPSLREWTVRDLVGHTSRSFLTVETSLDRPAKAVDMARPVDYYLRAAASLGDPARVAERGREAGEALGADPHITVRATAQRGLARVDREADDVLLTTPVGGIRLIDYLPSRFLELTIHTADIVAAVKLDGEAPPMRYRCPFISWPIWPLSVPAAAPLLLSMTGRGPLPLAFNVLPV